MEIKLTAKAEKLLAYIKEAGGGALPEWKMRDKLAMSHGSFCAARRELVEAGVLVLGKDVRKTTYNLTNLTGQPKCPEVTGQVHSSPKMTSQIQPPPQAKAAFMPPVRPKNVQEAIMPRVTGDFADFDSWLMEVNDRLGGCVDVSQSLVDEGEFSIYAPEFDGEDTYTIRDNDDGGITVD